MTSEHGSDPAQEALLADSVGLALLVVFETLTPAERLAFVLHDMFAVSFDEIATMLDRSPAAARQLASRARRRVRGEAKVPTADLGTQRALVNGAAGLLTSRDGQLFGVVGVTVEDGKIAELDILVDPRRLASLDLPQLDLTQRDLPLDG